MMKEKVQDAINHQITKEMFSSNLYLAMSAYYHSINLNGFAHWMRLQAQEEMTHALKFFDYMINRGANVEIGAIAEPKMKWDNPLVTFEEALEHEQMITASINKLAEIAYDEKDYATSSFLQWFIDEQVEEEATTSEIVERLKMSEGAKGPLFMLDTELKQRQLSAAE